ncbi:energy transducer TonB [Lysobacteraceae bacterium NML75-0749]|nr:energy transducer TonB [Xanthomonadaceae bacterium NML75-0749]PJK03695.1 energy transducer TonB [Xanthomonadaceae bacterium NML91-0268]
MRALENSITIPGKSNMTRNLMRGALLTAILGLMAACGGKGDEQAAQTQTAAPEVEPAAAVSSAVSAMGADELREAASKAVSEQRLYAPAGNNAMEYYLALRDKGDGGAAVSSALADLQPYTLIAAEQAITRDDFAEAKRLYALLEKTDPNAPALPRLKAGIADAENMAAQREQNAQADEARRQASEKKRQEEQRAAQQLAAQQLAAQRAEERRLEELRAAEAQQRQQASAREAEERRQAEQRAAAQRQAAAVAQQQQQTTPPPAPVPVKRNTELRAISAPQPRYPAEALRGGQSGSVQVEFTVGTSGAVTSARVVNANPPRVFNNEVLNTVRRWRFQPIDEPVTTRRTFTFNSEQ